MKSEGANYASRCDSSAEQRWGHPLLGFGRFLEGRGLWISHCVIPTCVAGALLLTSFERSPDQTTAPLATMMFGVALLFTFAAWVTGIQSLTERKDAQ